MVLSLYPRKDHFKEKWQQRKNHTKSEKRINAHQY